MTILNSKWNGSLKRWQDLLVAILTSGWNGSPKRWQDLIVAILTSGWNESSKRWQDLIVTTLSNESNGRLQKWQDFYDEVNCKQTRLARIRSDLKVPTPSSNHNTCGQKRYCIWMWHICRMNKLEAEEKCHICTWQTWGACQPRLKWNMNSWMW